MKLPFIFLFYLIIQSVGLTQGIGALETSYYAGVMGLNLQPANLASSPYSVDISIIGASASAAVKSFLPETKIGNSFYQGDEYSIGTTLTQEQKNFFINANVSMPSASYRINEKSGLAFTWHFRVVAYGTVTSSSLSLFVEEDFDVKTLAGKPGVESVSMIANTWEEFGLSYGHNLYNKGRHKLDAGISAKYLIGGASGYLEIDGLKVDYDESTNTLNNIEGKVIMTYNTEVDDLSEGKETKLFNSTGFGMTFGLNYEYKSAKHTQKKTDRLNQPNYLFKASTSLRDVGTVRFKASENSASYSLTQNEPIDAEDFNNIQSIDELSTNLQNTFAVDIKTFESYSLRLPTTWNINVDWNVWKNFYVNMYTDFTGIQMRTSFLKSEKLIQYKFSGRFEKAKYGFYSSLDYNKFSKWGSSFSVRYSILYLGVNNLIKPSGSRSINTFGVMLALKIPILNKSITKKNRIF